MVQQLLNIYCDESCHLENDGQSVMVLGGVWLPDHRKRSLSIGVRQLKEKHGLGWMQEIKWNKVSDAKLDFYLDLVKFFFSTKDLHFRGLVAQHKDKLNHENYQGQDHNEWYYKMYFAMLKQILNKNNKYNIYLDIKDTNGGRKIRKLHDVMCNNMYDFDHSIVERIQLIRSEESEFVQLADLFIGALSYFHRGLDSSEAKKAVVEKIKELSGHNLNKNTLPSEEKFNVFLWQPQECRGVTGV